MKPPESGVVPGTLMFMVGASNGKVYKYMLSTAWDISTASFDSDFSVSTQDSFPSAVFFKTDGTRMYVTGQGNDKVFEYSLATAWDITTASFDGDFSVNSQATNPNGLYFKPDGAKMYITGSTSDKAHEYSLSTAWDVTTASFDDDFSVKSQDIFPSGLFFKSDGTKMYVAGQDNNEIFEYSLSTAWDVTTASSAGSIAANGLGVNDVFFKSDGARMYVTRDFISIADVVDEHSLSTAWDVTTASYVDSFDVSSQDGGPSGIFING